jgi:NAD(P)-dependent dehydrogenase (short-subunit alcohol dehydrogenase family)
MSNLPVVLITGASGALPPSPSPKRARKSSLPVGVMRPARRSLGSCALSVRRPSSSTPMSATRMTSAPWSKRPSRGLARLDVAVNNAATEGQVGPITEQTAESFAATFETNVLGVVLKKYEVRAMRAQGSVNNTPVATSSMKESSNPLSPAA